MSENDKTSQSINWTEPEERRLETGAPNSTISRKLREFYDAVQEENIPDRFLDLLERLDQAEKSARSADAK